MSSFTQPLSYTCIGEELYQTEHEFTFYFDDDLSGEYITIPSKTVFNGASIPKIIKKIFHWDPMDVRWLQATVLHDSLVGEFNEKIKTSEGRTLSWNESNKWFNKALKIKHVQHNCPDFMRFLFCLAIYVHGVVRRKI